MDISDLADHLSRKFITKDLSRFLIEEFEVNSFDNKQFIDFVGNLKPNNMLIIDSSDEYENLPQYNYHYQI